MRELPHISIGSSALSASGTHVFSLRGREGISRLFEFSVGLVSLSDAPLDEDAVLAAPAELAFVRRGGEARRIHGIVSTVHDTLESETQHRAYTLTFVPRAWRLGLNEVSGVYVDQAVTDVIRTKLTAIGLREKDDFELRLDGSYSPRECIVQYRETDLQFVSRLAEHLGIAFFFEHDDGRDRMVFSDRNRAFREVPGRPRVAFYPRGEHMGVFQLDAVTRTLPRRVVVEDYNYRTPKVSLLAEAPVLEAGVGEVVEYGVHCKTPAEAAALAKVRAEELLASRRVYSGKSTEEALVAGATCKVEGHPRGDVEVLITEIEHGARQPILGAGTDAQPSYENSFRAIPRATAFRPARTTPKPRVVGAISGIVEAEQEGEYAELDDAGRYRVRFLFDTAQSAHGKASHAVRMAQPHAGPGYGLHFPLRDGVEVLLTCIDGDPDRPIISGAVPNPTTPSTVAAKNATRNVIRTGGGTEINIDDTKGSERVKITVPFGNTVLQLGAPNDPTPGVVLGTQAKAKLEAAEDVTVSAGIVLDQGAGTQIKQHAPLIDITASSSVDIDGGGSLSAKAATATVHGAGSLTLTSGGQVVAGANTITITADGVVTISGATVNIEHGSINIEGGEVNVKGGTIKLNC